MLDSVERRTEGSTTDERVRECCISRLTVVGWEFLGRDYWDSVSGTRLLLPTNGVDELGLGPVAVG